MLYNNCDIVDEKNDNSENVYLIWNVHYSFILYKKITEFVVQKEQLFWKYNFDQSLAMYMYMYL